MARLYPEDKGMSAGPVEMEMSILIRAPAEAVWPYLVDWENLDRWMTEARDFKVTSPNREGIGVTAQATINIMGITTTDPVEVTRWEPPSTLEIEHQGWVSGKGLMRCIPEWSGTRLLWIETLSPPLWLLGAAGIRLFRPVMRRIFQHDLSLLKALVESNSNLPDR
ncbi:MAG: SRPBCC family protein [Actinomycetota bacterium]